MNAICAEPTRAEAGAATRRAFACALEGTAALLVRAASRSVAALCAGAGLVQLWVTVAAIVLSPAPARTSIAA